MFYISDNVYTCIAVDCQTPSDEYVKAFLNVSIKNDREAEIKPSLYACIPEDGEPQLVKSEIERLVFYKDNECYKEVRLLAEAIAQTPLGHINNEALPLANANYLMCLMSDECVEFLFINAPTPNDFEDKVCVKEDRYALKALRNFATDMRKLNDKMKIKKETSLGDN